jgi:hypothetical protein
MSHRKFSLPLIRPYEAPTDSHSNGRRPSVPLGSGHSTTPPSSASRCHPPSNISASGALHGATNFSRLTWENRRLISLLEWALAFGSLRTIRIPSNIEILGDGCFTWCRQLADVNFDDGCFVNVIGECAFSYSSIREFMVPASVEVLWGYVFYS